MLGPQAEVACTYKEEAQLRAKIADSSVLQNPTCSDNTGRLFFADKPILVIYRKLVLNQQKDSH